MGYEGYLIKVGSYKIPFRFIEASTYKDGIKGKDLEAFEDTDGITQRHALKNVAIKVEWEVPSPVMESELREMMGGIQRQYKDSVEKKAEVTAWMPEIGRYVTQDCYVPDIEFQIDYADEKDIEYGSFRIAFIRYGGKL